MLTRKWKAKFQVSLEKKFIPGWREKKSLLDEPRAIPQFERGYPVFGPKIDTGSKSVSGQRKYKAPQTKVVVDKSFTETNFHEMQGRFKFEILGRFYQAGEVFEKEAFKAADDLYLAGYIKSRGAFVKGDLQGDVYALSYMQKWLKQGHHSREAGDVTSVRIYDENFGVPDLPKRTLRCIKDWRKHYTKRDQFEALKLKEQVNQMKQHSLQQQKDKEKFIASNQVFNY